MARPRPLSLDRQAALVQLWYPEFRAKLTDHKLVITGVVQPTPMSERYSVRIAYKWRSIPRVNVLRPELVPREPGVEIPHRHTDEDHPLCLFYGRDREWSAYDVIAFTTIPWTSEWLLFYEIWLATGEWLGGGVEHGPASIVSDGVLADAC